MISEKMLQALNRQINNELYSAYLYYSMAAYFEDQNLFGFANWFKVQTKEELFHADKIYQYVNDRNGRVILEAIAAPPTTWNSLLTAFEDALKHEMEVTKMINELVDLSLAERDYPTNHFLQWFLGEQIEEEASASQLVEKMKLVGDDRSGLFLLDQELGSRIFSTGADSAS
ncbi:MAG: ferritin [bacterium]